MPTIPSASFGPSSAIHKSLRINNRGRRTAVGLPGCAAQYAFICSEATLARSIAFHFLTIGIISDELAGLKFFSDLAAVNRHHQSIRVSEVW